MKKEFLLQQLLIFKLHSVISSSTFREKVYLSKILEETRHEVSSIKSRYDELKQSKQDVELQVMCLTM